MNKNTFKDSLRNFQFSKLFNDLGWDNFRFERDEIIKEISCKLTGVAEKRGFVILQCHTPEGLNYSERKQVETNVTKLYHEHLIIFTENTKKQQIWQVPIKQFNKPKLIREFEYYTHQEPELLFEKHKGLLFTIDEEENVSLVDVIGKVTSQFDKNAEKVTKKFYEDFRKEHQAFIKLISGITDDHHREWYTSLMLNRLMFVYFLQRRGFLSNDPDYLVHKLKEVKILIGQNKFQSFYRDFLLILFHVGLGQPANERVFTNPLHATIMGRIPYLNGGLFEVHQIENLNPNISIPDSAFERLFKFFDEWNWHLDTRIKATGKDINPDVLGYIFEKYINYLELQKDAGAYYTKEDITDYISKNCIIPFLFDKVKEKHPSAFKTDGFVWEILYNSPDEYIYDAVKHGINLPTNYDNDLPTNFKNYTNLDDHPLIREISVISGQELNKQAPAEIALPTEIYREVRDRRKRYIEIRNKIENREIADINDFITYNLNIRKFTVDVIANAENSDFINEFYKALCNITILDPTCGSGAFLFAALNILEDLYEECINRMSYFVKELDNDIAKHRADKFKQFKKVIDEINLHPNQQYYIYKTIILRNLYGVDIMNEATEIAKLRLFLKLVATTQPDFKHHNLGLEPLPDIDFNIRSGNTLVGFATEKELDKALTYTLDGQYFKPAVLDLMQKVALTYKRYKEIQLEEKSDYAGFAEAKKALIIELDKLNNELNHYLSYTYGQAPKTKPKEYSNWLETHKPFHWFAEFYEIINQKSGFDVIIGNPPYVEYSKIDYKLNGFETIKCGNLYSFVIERSLFFLTNIGRFGMIIPISSVCTDRMIDYQKLLRSRNCWNSLYAERPSKLFSGAEVQLVISIISNIGPKAIYSTTYNKWGSDYRDFLFQNIFYTDITPLLRKGSFPKIGSKVEKSIILKLLKQKKTINSYQVPQNENFISYRNAGGRYYKVILNYEPNFKVNNEVKRSSTYQFLFFNENNITDSICALMNSSLFFWYWLIYSDTWHMVNREIGSFPIEFTDKLSDKLVLINKRLIKDLKLNSVERIENRNKGVDTIEFTQFNVRESKPIIDEIDRVLAEHYGFTEEELDFIINYDIKYRMGKELDEE